MTSVPSFASAAARGAIRVMPRGINPDVIYELRSADPRTHGRAARRGSDCRGLEITEAPESDAQVLVLDPIASATRVK